MFIQQIQTKGHDIEYDRNDQTNYDTLRREAILIEEIRGICDAIVGIDVIATILGFVGIIAKGHDIYRPASPQEPTNFEFLYEPDPVGRSDRYTIRVAH